MIVWTSPVVAPVVSISDVWVQAVQSETLTGLVVAFAWLGSAFCLGVGWAAYRSVGWTNRMRAWAYSLPADTPMLRECIANQELEGVGME